MDDPFFIVKREVEQSLSQIYGLLKEQKGRGLTTDIQDRLQNIAADLDELDETIQIVMENPSKFNLDKREISDRKQFINNTRKEIKEIKSKLQSKANAGSLDLNKAPSTKRGAGIENEQQQQQQLFQRQDEQMDQIGGVVRNLREIGEVMGNELEDQERLLGETDARVDATEGRMQDGIKRMKEFITANSSIKQQLAIIGLVILLVVLLIIVVSM